MSLPKKKEIERRLPSIGSGLAWLALLGVFLWFYWPALCRLVEVWWKNEDYQHGFFVPLFSLFLLWHRREMMPGESIRGSLWGLPLFAFWAAMRWTAIYYNYGTLTDFSMVPFFIGTTLFVGGWPALRWAWPSILFLVFMFPLPGFVQDFSREHLQKLATLLSVFVIQTLGIQAVAQGVVIEMSNRTLQVAEACSGLRMMMLFAAICLGAAFVVRRPLWERIVMVLSAPPIAVISNVARIVLTALLGEAAHAWPSLVSQETADYVIHQLMGYFMMPIGLALLLAEMSLLSRLVFSEESQGAARKMLTGVEIQSGASRSVHKKNSD